MNKKGMELAINQIVILIVGIVIFGLGLMLVTKIMGSGGDQLNVANDQIKAQFEKSLSSDRVVDISNKNRNMQAGDIETFYLGIFNDPSLVNNDEKFFVIITPADKTEETKNSINVFGNPPSGKVCNGNSICFDIEDLYNNDIEAYPIVISPKESSLGRGQYVYNVCVCYGSSGNQFCDSATSCTKNSVSEINNLYGFTTFSINVR